MANELNDSPTPGGWLNYHHLLYFKTIADCGSVSEASRKLKVGQSALSIQLRQLEDQLGIELFDRKNRKMTLTEAGKVALSYARDIFNRGAELKVALKRRSKPGRGHITIGALDSVPKRMISDLVVQAVRSFNATITVREGSEDELYRELLNHQIDILLTNHGPKNIEGHRLLVRHLAKHPVIVCGAAKFEDLKKNFPDSIRGKPFILPTQESRLRTDLQHYWDSHGIEVDCIAETQDTSLLKLLGSRGVGLIPVIQAAVQSRIKPDGDLIKIGTLEGVFEEFHIVSLKGWMENPIVDQLMRAPAVE
jgi:LysR family transcriptional activator of nhaA